MPLTIESLGTGNVTFTNFNPNITNNTSYKKNDGEWTTVPVENYAMVPIPVVAGDVIQFKGTNGVSSAYYNGAPVINSTAQFKVKGNIMSLYIGDGFEEADTITISSLYANFFKNATNLVSAKGLILPATTLSSQCYSNMFEGCTNLADAPMVLPATTLANYCYQYMFKNCSSLTCTPTLPATTLASSCYNSMFYGCTSLTSVSTLPATTMVSGCYSYMFYGCTSLVRAPELPATTLYGGCYGYMFKNCSSLNYIKALMTTAIGYNSGNSNEWVSGVAANGTFVMNPNAEWYDRRNDPDVRSEYGIPAGWTIEDA